MKLNERQEKLLTYVKHAHRKQFRKYTGLPYHTHLVSVARIAWDFLKETSFNKDMIIETALLHDIIEDTPVSPVDLIDDLMDMGYTHDLSLSIVSAVLDLTDLYTTARFPQVNRSKRKVLEAQRLANIPPFSQSIKYADLMDNTSDIMDNDPGFGKIYLEEKAYIMSLMKMGHYPLYDACMMSMNENYGKIKGVHSYGK